MWFSAGRFLCGCLGNQVIYLFRPKCIHPTELHGYSFVLLDNSHLRKTWSFSQLLHSTCILMLRNKGTSTYIVIFIPLPLRSWVGENWPMSREIALPCSEDNKSDENKALERRGMSTNCQNDTVLSELVFTLNAEKSKENYCHSEKREFNRNAGCHII